MGRSEQHRKARNMQVGTKTHGCSGSTVLVQQAPSQATGSMRVATAGQAYLPCLLLCWPHNVLRQSATSCLNSPPQSRPHSADQLLACAAAPNAAAANPTRTPAAPHHNHA